MSISKITAHGTAAAIGQARRTPTFLELGGPARSELLRMLSGAVTPNDASRELVAAGLAQELDDKSWLTIAGQQMARNQL